MTAAVTERPTAPTCCGEAGCAHDPSRAPTRRIAPVDQVLALVELDARINADRATLARGVAGLSPVDQARFNRLRCGEGCADCGRPAMRGTRRCMTCEVAVIQAERAG